MPNLLKIPKNLRASLQPHNRRKSSHYSAIGLTTTILVLFSPHAAAYVGPGLGLGVIGAILGTLAALLMAIVGLFWYPIKTMFKKNNGDVESHEEVESPEENESMEEAPQEFLQSD